MSLAVSNVQVRDPRMRLLVLVLVHAVLCFFSNGSIMVTALGTISSFGG